MSNLAFSLPGIYANALLGGKGPFPFQIYFSLHHYNGCCSKTIKPGAFPLANAGSSLSINLLAILSSQFLTSQNLLHTSYTYALLNENSSSETSLFIFKMSTTKETTIAKASNAHFLSTGHCLSQEVALLGSSKPITSV